MHPVAYTLFADGVMRSAYEDERGRNTLEADSAQEK